MVSHCASSISRDWRRKKADQDLPPYNGFGSEEDSKTSCNGLEPRPPQRDFHKFMNRDRYPKMIGGVDLYLQFEGFNSLHGLRELAPKYVDAT